MILLTIETDLKLSVLLMIMPPSRNPKPSPPYKKLKLPAVDPDVFQ